MPIFMSGSSGKTVLRDILGNIIETEDTCPTLTITAVGVDHCKALSDAVLPTIHKLNDEYKRSKAIIKRPCTAIELHRDSARA